MAKPYDRWSIVIHLRDSGFEGMTGDLRHIDRVASTSNLTRLRTNALIGTFSGAEVEFVFYDGVGPASITITPPHDEGQEIEWTASMDGDMQNCVRRLLHNVYQRMDWFVEG